MLSLRNIAAFLLILSCAAHAPAQEWPRFRGPNGSGLSEATDIPAQWSPKDFKWKIALPGVGHSSPVAWGDLIFVTCADDHTGARTILGINGTTGAVAWKREFASHTFREHGDNSYASSTPAVDADHVYVCWSTPEALTLVALDHAGQDAWEADLGPFVSQHGGGNSPIVVGDLVLVGDDNEGRESFLFGFDRHSGQSRWKVPRHSDKFSAATPCVFETAGGTQQVVFTSWREGMTSVDPLTGKTLWSLPDAFDSRTVGSPIASGGLVFASCGEGPGGHSLTVAKPDSAATKASVAYSLRQSTPYVPTPLVKGDLLFYLADSGVLTCAKAATGATVWQQRIGGSFYSSPVCAGDKLIMVSKKGEVIICSATEKFEVLGRNLLEDKCHATPAIANGNLYVRTYGHLACISGTKKQ